MPGLSAKASESQVFLYQMNLFKQDLLADMPVFDRIALTVSESLQDWRFNREEATCTELSYLYLKKVSNG